MSIFRKILGCFLLCVQILAADYCQDIADDLKVLVHETNGIVPVPIELHPRITLAKLLYLEGFRLNPQRSMSTSFW